MKLDRKMPIFIALQPIIVSKPAYDVRYAFSYRLMITIGGEIHTYRPCLIL